MLLTAKNLAKTMGAKLLFKNLTFTIMPGEKVALIGRNGHGKTTLLKVLSGYDDDHGGEIETRKNTKIILTKQEHYNDAKITPLLYILKSVPNYFQYQKILSDYESGLNHNLDKYLRTLEKFTELKYLNLEGAVLSTLADFNISNQKAKQPLANLSGGQKRYVEMARMMFSRADLLLVDEPTNHLDFKGKKRFIAWMKSLKQSIVVVTHDRDVLKHVDRIIELKDQKAIFFKGNFDSYIAQNTMQTLTSVKLYSDQLNRLREAKKKMDWGFRMKAKSKQWKTRYVKWTKEYEKIKAETVKPSFWIDQDSVGELDQKVVGSYQKFKEKNINIRVKTDKNYGSRLLSVNKLALGYDDTLFENLNFTLREGERVFIKGRNGAGKSTLVRTIVSQFKNKKSKAVILDGEIELSKDLRIGEYEQEIDKKYLDLTLEDAIEKSYQQKNMKIDTQKIYSLLAQYLFDPKMDSRQRIRDLSGGQKARFQLIKMLAGNPNLLILDEPTNHLDLPSIEELENALEKFAGGILYISHDSYFIKKMGGDLVEIKGTPTRTRT